MSSLIQQFNSLYSEQKAINKILRTQTTSKKSKPFILDLYNLEQKSTNRLYLNFLGQRELIHKDILINLDHLINKSIIKIQAFFTCNNLPTKARSNQYMQGFISKKILRYNARMPNFFHRLCINKAGIPKIVTAFKYTNELNQHPVKMNFMLQNIINKTREISKIIFLQVFEWMNLYESNFKKTINPKFDHNDSLEKADLVESMIVKYIEASTYAPQFNNLGQDDEKDKKQLSKLDKIQRIWAVDDILDLYSFNPERLLREKLQFCDYKISLDQLARMKTRLQFPTIRQQNKQRQSRYIFNYVKVQNPQNIVFVEEHQGGAFSNIKFAKITFCCIQTSVAMGYKQSAPSYTGPITKPIFFKFPKYSQQNRLQHQINILSKLKLATSSSCSFLIKYYYSSQDSIIFKNTLMADAHRQLTLNQYLHKNAYTTSYYTKCHLMVQLAQALRFLKNYQIAHLDIKPNNMFVWKQGLLKLFDFGQAYHPQVCKNKQFFPGFTLPYTAPEYFKGIYSCQNDIFSFGIMLLQIFFKISFIPGKKLLKTYKEQTYHKRMFIVDEELDSYCQRKIAYCLFNLIMKCLNKDPSKRPNAAWIIVVLVELLLLF